MSRTGSASQGLWHEAEATPMEPIQVKGVSQKNNWKLHEQRPLQKKEKKRKENAKREKQLYLERAGRKVER